MFVVDLCNFFAKLNAREPASPIPLFEQLYHVIELIITRAHDRHRLDDGPTHDSLAYHHVRALMSLRALLVIPNLLQETPDARLDVVQLCVRRINVLFLRLVVIPLTP